jgi:peptidoglycan/xylan/chitin deacetylase (PgdA/CDA1 family)
MTIRSIISSAGRKTVSQKIFRPLWHRLWQNDTFCLMLHRIAERDENRLKANENMKVSPSYLESFILDAKTKGYAFISLNDLAKAIIEHRYPSHSIVLTLDDGYKDNVLYGLPLFQKYEVPFTVYLSTYFVEHQETPWWYLLETLLLNCTQVVWGNKTYNAASLSSKECLFMELRQAALDDSRGAAYAVDSVCRQNNLFAEGKESLFMNWADVSRLSNESLAEIGNHGHTHSNLTLIISEVDIQREFATANELIYHHTGQYPKHYCFPYGLYDSRVLNVLKELEVVTCVTTAGEVLKYANCNDFLLEIPRVMLTEGVYMDDLLSERTYRYLRKIILRTAHFLSSVKEFF